ncbi:MAG TPA: NAD(P)(+) transhydrogenase (Re/Si-specific) subunit beta [Candidatus Omnitrophota bacterium]|nr:NAD(P)(+) transhydrogenase (Re/Si-specific) subunit beta [Candidatus Omnitrophota bacterium]HSA31574.1 NAD(P)(+) transhydrogenase (Re/Si-specific) subunit beta [Candidatus Omnitrophota bacterium]
MNSIFWINFSYIIAAVLFALGLKMMGAPASARKGNALSAIAMLIAVIATLLTQGLSYHWIILGVVIGSVLGTMAARMVAMTAMPEMVALLNGSGGLASLLVGWIAYDMEPGAPLFTTISVYLSVLIGGVTFTGSVVAWGKLSEKISSKPFLYKGQKIVNSLIVAAILLLGLLYCLDPVAQYSAFLMIILLSLILGVLAVIPIGGADMPVVISLLNSYSGLAACAAGFVIQNNILIVAGALVGASGIILTQIMCKAMNRSLANVLFSGFGSVTQQQSSAGAQGEVRSLSVEDAFYLLEAAQSVVFVPGYGLAVAQAQHVVQELAQILERNGAEVRFAIHPVAGRMPGHMNVLLAEANVPYDQLFEMDAINPLMESIDVAVVIGANDVVNPAARNTKDSPIYGMPIINVDKAKTVIVLKRSMATGFAGIQNELFFYENTRMLFGDAKATIQTLIAEFKN